MINNEIDYYVHPSAIIDAGAHIGVGTRIWHWTHICQTAKIGMECTIGQNVYVADRVCIGDRVKIQNNVSIYEGVTLEDDVFCGPSMVFTNVINPRSFINRKQAYKATLVKRGATIGANVTVVCGNTIGRYALVGAGSVVIKNVADHALVVGNPARHIGWVCYCGATLPNQQGQVFCTACQQSYRVARGGISTILSSFL